MIVSCGGDIIFEKKNDEKKSTQSNQGYVRRPKNFFVYSLRDTNFAGKKITEFVYLVYFAVMLLEVVDCHLMMPEVYDEPLNALFGNK